MDSERNNEETIYYTAVKKPATERSVYLKSACGDDLELLARIESLLRVHEQRGDFMEAPFLVAGVTVAENQLAEGPGNGHWQIQAVGEDW